MKSSLFGRSRWTEHASVACAIVAGAVLFFEILSSQLPSHWLAAISRSRGVAAWTVVAAVGISMLVKGVGVIAVSGIRLFVAIRKTDEAGVRAIANDHLVSVVVVVVVLGFVFSVIAFYMLSQIKP
jgi:predicted phage tail protein